jgi:uncharacterized phage protein gp47/JayE
VTGPAPLATVAQPIVDLQLFDVDEQTLVDNAIAAIQTLVPTFQPVEGNTEVVLVEASALLVATTMYTINQLGQSVLDNLVALQGVTRLPGAQAAGSVTVAMTATTVGAQILPAGSTFRVYNLDGSSVDLTSVADTPHDPTVSLTFPVQVQAAVQGTYPNLIPVGTPAVLVDVLTWVDSATTGALTGGADPETDDAFYLRAAVWFATQNHTLVLPVHFASAALNVAGVGRSVCINLWDGTGAAAGTVAGHVTVVVATATGTACTPQVKSNVLATLTANSTTGLTSHVIDPTFKHFAVTCTISVVAGQPPADVITQVVRALSAALDPAVRQFGQPLYVNQLIVIAGEVNGVYRVVTLTATVNGVDSASYVPSAVDLPDGPATVNVTAV